MARPQLRMKTTLAPTGVGVTGTNQNGTLRTKHQFAVDNCGVTQQSSRSILHSNNFLVGSHDRCTHSLRGSLRRAINVVSPATH